MTISEYVAQLLKMREEHGDLHVYGTNFGSAVLGAVNLSQGPRLRNLAIPKGREHVLRTYHEGLDNNSQKGVKICKV